MSSEGGGESVFSRGFLPGLVLGLVIGAFAGAVLPPMLAGGKKPVPMPSGTGQPSVERDQEVVPMEEQPAPEDTLPSTTPEAPGEGEHPAEDAGEATDPGAGGGG